MGLLAPELGWWAELQEQDPELSQAGEEAKVENTVCGGSSSDQRFSQQIAAHECWLGLQRGPIQDLPEVYVALFFSPFHPSAEGCM